MAMLNSQRVALKIGTQTNQKKTSRNGNDFRIFLGYTPMCGDDCWLHKPVKPPMFDLYGLVDLWQNLNRKQNGRYPQMSWICLYFPPIREVVDGS